MKYCSFCGSELTDQAVVCIKCGCSVRASPVLPDRGPAPVDVADTGIVVLCVLFPIIGLIMWALKKDETPNAAKAYGKAALITVCVGVGLVIVLCLIAVVGIFSLARI